MMDIVAITVGLSLIAMYIFVTYLYAKKNAILGSILLVIADTIAISSWNKYMSYGDKILVFAITFTSLFVVVSAGYGIEFDKKKFLPVTILSVISVILIAGLPGIVANIYHTTPYKSIVYERLDNYTVMTFYPSSEIETYATYHNGTYRTITTTKYYSSPVYKLIKIDNSNIIVKCGVACFAFTGDSTTMKIDGETWVVQINT